MAELPALDQIIHSWPPNARKELVDFIAYLQYKYGTEAAIQVARLGGLWADVALDPTDEDVRALRQRVTQQVVEKV